MRVFSTLMSWSNENKSCMRVEQELKRESLREFIFCLLLRREDIFS